MADGTSVVNDETANQEDPGPDTNYWIAQLEISKKAAKQSIDDTRDAWQEYLAGPRTTVDARDVYKAPETRYPIFWASVRMIQPAMYSRTPEPVAEKAFDYLDDNIARISCLCLERLANYLIRACPYDRVQYATRDSFILGGKATNRICLRTEIKDETQRIAYIEQQIPTGQVDPATGQPQIEVVYLDAQGQPPPDGVQLQQDDEGIFAEVTQSDLSYICVDLQPVHYRDILHNANARHWEEVDWVAFRHEMLKSDVKEQFGDQIATELPYKELGADRRNRMDEQQQQIPINVAIMWEIWDRRKKEVYWLCEGYNQEMLKPLNYEGGDPYELCGFFPCPPFMLGTCSADSLYPVPDYVQLRPLIDQLHGMARRLRVLVRALRRRGVYDGSISQLSALAEEADEAEWIAVDNFKELIGDAGLEAIVKTFPTAEIASATQELAQLIQLYKDEFSEIWGIPDLMRGTSDPSETAAAQQIKGNFLVDRFSVICREFQRLNRDDIELMCDLALKKFPQSKLEEIMGLRFMPQEEQQLWPQVLQLLQDDDERKVRINIETDSTITMNQNADIEQRNYLAQTLTQGIASIAQASQGNPAFVSVTAEALLFVIQGLQKGKNIEEKLRQAIEQATQPQQQGPDPEQQKAAAQMQQQQHQMQLDMQKAQMQMQIEQQKAQLELQITQVKAQTEMQLQVMKTQSEMYQAERQGAQSMQLEQLDAIHQQQLKAAEAKLKELDASLSLALEKYKADNSKEAAMTTAAKSGGPKTVEIHLGDKIGLTQ